MFINNIIFGVVLFLNILEYFIIFDVILSFLIVLGVPFRPKFLSDLLDPLYLLVRKYIPVRIGMIDFTPLILIFLLGLMRGFLFVAFPGVNIFFTA